MTEPNLLQQQHELLATWRQVNARRRSAEAFADEQLAAGRDGAEALFRAVNQAAEELDSIRERQQRIANRLAEGKWPATVTGVSAQPTTHRQGADPARETAAALSRAKSALDGLDRLLDPSRGAAENKSKTTQRYVFLVIAAVITFVFLPVARSHLYNLLDRFHLLSETMAVLVTIVMFVGGLFLAAVLTRLVNEWFYLQPRRSQYTALVQALADGRDWSERWRERIRPGYEEKMAEVHAADLEQRAVIAQTFTGKCDRLKSQLDALTGMVAAVSPSWRETGWDAWQPAAAAAPVLTIGDLRLANAYQDLLVPAILPPLGGQPLVFGTMGSAQLKLVDVVQSLLLRMLATIPPGKVRFTFIDPVGLGKNVAPFMHLADYDETLVTGKAWVEPQQIEQRLADLTEYMENVLQKYLRNQFASIEEYNVYAGEVAEAYRVLVVMDCPTNLSEAAIRRLISIMQNGPRCGVYTLVTIDGTKALPYGVRAADVYQNASVFALDAGRFKWLAPEYQDCLVDLDVPGDAGLFDRIVHAVGKAAKEASRVEVPFTRIAPDPGRWWMGDSRSELRLPLGPSGARKVQELALGSGVAQHALVVGKTGSGKSTLLHTLITGLALAYSPDEAQLYLIDFKKGVEFKTYAAYQLPHARVIAIESEREFGLSVLQGLDAELQRRGDLFRAHGVDHIADYRARNRQPMPRILLLVDEFQEFFAEDDAVASQAAQILDRLVRQGRAFGIHVLLGSQTLAGSYSLARSTIDQMAIRIALQCSEADSRLILADDNPAARLLSRPGEAIYNAANGLVEGNNRFQVAWLPDDERDRYLDEVQRLARERGCRPAEPQIVFEGNAPGLIENNRALADLLNTPGWPAPARAVPAWLGEPVAIREPVAAIFRRQSGSNLLVVGSNEEAALGLMAAGLVSLAAQVPAVAGQPSFYVLDFGAAEGPDADYVARLAGCLPPPVRVGRRRQLPEMMAELEAEVQRRLAAEDAPGREAAAQWPIYLFLYGLQRARDLRQEDSLSFSSYTQEPAGPSPAQQFNTIVREGPDVGVHTLVWCDTVTNLSRSLDSRALREFTMRVALQMSAEDSSRLIDTSVAGKLGAYRALFLSEEEGRLEKLRPYGPPSDEWLHWAAERLRERG